MWVTSQHSGNLHFYTKGKKNLKTVYLLDYYNACLSLLCQDGLTKAYSVAVKNSGIASVKIREDGRIMACGGWDGRFVT